MNDRPTALERAFAMARSGDYAQLTDLRKQLRAEGFSERQIEGPTITRQLRALITTALAAKADPEA